MRKRPAPMSNTERQRQFRERNPGYYGRLHRKRTARIKAALAQMNAAAEAQALAETQAQACVPAVMCSSTPLMLPAPVVDPLAVEIAALAESLKQKQRVA